MHTTNIPPLSHAYIHILQTHKYSHTHIHTYTYYNNVYLKIFKWVGYVVAESIKVEARCAECDRKRKSGSDREERVNERVGGLEGKRRKRVKEREVKERESGREGRKRAKWIECV